MIRIISVKRMRYVARMEEVINAYKSLDGKCKGKRLRRRIKHGINDKIDKIKIYANKPNVRMM
jgi:hypothetical protein